MRTCIRIALMTELKEYEEVKSQLKTELRENRASQQLQRWQVLCLRSPSAESTGVSLPQLMRLVLHKSEQRTYYQVRSVLQQPLFQVAPR